jgi:regulation of enolase protein 1 (concanavalin A-like superfamily)
MKKTLLTCLAVVSFCLGAQKAQAQKRIPQKEKVIFEDHFQHALKSGWYWLRPSNNAHQITSEGLLMKSLDGNIWGPQKTGQNFLLRTLPRPEEGIITQVSITSTPDSPFEQAGLIWYNNDSTYIKLVVESFNGEKIVNMVREEKDQPVIFKQDLNTSVSKPLSVAFQDNKAVLVDIGTNRAATVDLNQVTAKQIDLRLSVQSGEIIGTMKAAGEAEWKTVGKCSLFAEANFKVGFITLMGSREKPAWVEFDKFSIRKSKASAKSETGALH